MNFLQSCVGLIWVRMLLQLAAIVHSQHVLGALYLPGLAV